MRVESVESELEREVSARLMGNGDAKPRRVAEGETIFSQGDEDDDTLLLVLDGVVAAEVDGEVVGEVGPGAIVGERAALEGQRTATVRARTPAKLMAFSASELEPADRRGCNRPRSRGSLTNARSV
jgi:CRP-like cAMP-binding protein